MNLIIGLGNLLMHEDALAPYIVRKIEEEMGDTLHSDIDFKENYSGGVEMLQELLGYEKVIIVDSIEAKDYEPGTCVAFDINELEEIHYEDFGNTHGLNLSKLWNFGEKLGYKLPEECCIYSIVGNDVHDIKQYFPGNASKILNSITNQIEEKAHTWIN